MTGKVKWFNSQKGYGFITDDESGREYFVHFSDIVSDGFKKLFKDDRVNFSTQEGKNGLQAAEVKKM